MHVRAAACHRENALDVVQAEVLVDELGYVVRLIVGHLVGEKNQIRYRLEQRQLICSKKPVN